MAKLLNIKAGHKKINAHVGELKKHSLEKTTTLIISAFGLVAALAWNSAIQGIFSVFFKQQSGLIAMLLYAIFVTVIAVVVTIYLSRLQQ
jgi:magnesium-transporting ATPase (P-type)